MTSARPRKPGPWRNPKRAPVATHNPLIRQLFSIMEQRGIAIRQIARATFYCQSHFRLWASGKSGMKLTSFVDIANYLGYDVLLVPRNADPSNPQPPESSS